MTAWKKRLEIGSRRAIQRGVRELQRIGFISSATARTRYEPIQYYGSFSYTKRLAVVEFRDGTKMLVIAVGPSRRDIPRPWRPYHVDIQGATDPKKSKDPRNAMRLRRVMERPVVVWAPRESTESVLDFWGYALAKYRQVAIREKMGWK